MVIAFHVNGIPKGQPRPRSFAKRIGRKFTARVYDPATAEGWKSDIAIAAKSHLPAAPFEGPVSLEITFFLPRPKRLCRKKDCQIAIPATCRPDVDNLAKAAMDALTTVGMWADDAQVHHLTVRKYYHGIKDKPGAFITIETED